MDSKFIGNVPLQGFSFCFHTEDRVTFSGGGGTLVLFMVRGRAIFKGTFFKPLRNYGYHFHNFFTFHGIMGVLFRGFFIIYGIGPHIYSICGIMALKSTRIYGIMGTNLSGKMARPHHIIG